MPQFHVNITETILQMEAPTDATPVVRMVDWMGEASDDASARESALVAWDEKYGPGARPTQAQTRTWRLDG